MEKTETSEVIFMGDRSGWVGKVDPGKLSEDARYRILEYVVDKFGKKKVAEIIGISRITLWRLLNRKSPVKSGYVLPLLELLSPDEFESIVKAREKLKSLGILRDDGTIDYSLALEILAVAKNDEYLKNALLKFVVSNFREDLRNMLGAGFSGIKLEWTDDFEVFLRERKRRKKVLSKETLSYYRNLFKKYLEGKELDENLVDFVVTHKNKWLRNVLRHYVQYLYHKRKIGPEVFGWIMEVVPSRTYQLDVRPYQISLDDVRNTLSFLENNHIEYYTIYRLLIESGARFEHALAMINDWRPEEMIEIPWGDIVTKRLICYPKKGFCRYYLGLRGTQKPCEWVYFSKETLELIESLGKRSINRHQVRKYVKRHELILPKYIRKIAWRLMVKTLGREIARFVQSRLGELKISEARYEDLLQETDSRYNEYLTLLKDLEIIGNRDGV